MENFLTKRPGEAPSRPIAQLVHVQFMKEGIQPPLRELRRFVRSVAPDVTNDSITITNSFINEWPKEPVNVILTSLAQTDPNYLAPDYLRWGFYSISSQELRYKDGSRMLILRVYANNPAASAKKKEMGWFSKLFGRSQSG